MGIDPVTASGIMAGANTATKTGPTGGGGGGGADIANMGINLAEKGVNLANVIDQIYMRHKTFNESKRQFDKTFNENVRQFGLEYALRDFATRKNISLAQAQQLYNAEHLELQKQAQGENIKTSALARNIASTQFNWQKQDRLKHQNTVKAMQKGLVSGLMGGT
jgi:hypothetical protein